jgi:hypothetical protein
MIHIVRVLTYDIDTHGVRFVISSFLRLRLPYLVLYLLAVKCFYNRAYYEVLHKKPTEDPLYQTKSLVHTSVKGHRITPCPF